MSQTNINIRMDLELKKQFEKFCKETGLNMSTAFNMFVKSMLRTGGLPFEARIENYNVETIKAIQETENIINGKVKRPTYKNTKELFDALDKED